MADAPPTPPITSHDPINELVDLPRAKSYQASYTWGATSDFGVPRTNKQNSSFTLSTPDEGKIYKPDIFASVKFTIDPSWPLHRKILANVIRSNKFDMVMGAIIVGNMCLVWLQTDTKAKCITRDDEACSESRWVQIVNAIFLATYCVEVATRIYVSRSLYFRSLANCADAFVVFLGIVGEIGGEIVSAIEILRLLRILRLFRGFRILSTFRELYLIIHGFFSTLRAIAWASVLMFMMLTLFSIVSVELLHPLNVEMAKDGVYKTCDRCPRAFQSILEANLTFFQTLVVGDGWSLVFIPMIEKHPWTAIIFLTAFLSIALGVMNLILAVIVDGAAEAREADMRHQIILHEERRAQAKIELGKLCEMLDTNEDGSLSLVELQAAYETSGQFRSALHLLDVSKDDLECVFKIMDVDDSGDVSHEEFAELLYQIKAQNSRTLLMIIKYYILEVRSELFKAINSSKDDVLERLDNSKQSSDSSMKPEVSNGRVRLQVDEKKANTSKGRASLQTSLASSADEPKEARVRDFGLALQASPGSPLSLETMLGLLEKELAVLRAEVVQEWEGHTAVANQNNEKSRSLNKAVQAFVERVSTLAADLHQSSSAGVAVIGSKGLNSVADKQVPKLEASNELPGSVVCEVGGHGMTSESKASENAPSAFASGVGQAGLRQSDAKGENLHASVATRQ